MTLEYANRILALIVCGPFKFEAFQSPEGTMYLQASFEAPCTVTGVLQLQRSRKWMLSKHMTRSEVVQTAFKCALTAIEHELREMFTYRGQAIFGPHFDVDALANWGEFFKKDVRA